MVRDEVGVNAGMSSLASGQQVLAHFDCVMQERFLPSGRVRFLPMTEYLGVRDGAHRVRSLTSGDEQSIAVGRKLVNATHAATATPATHPPKYAVSPQVAFTPVHRLPEIRKPYACYTIVGSGKTGIDACLWLLDNGVPPARIRWLMPRDAWYMDRANLQPGVENFDRSMGSTLSQLEAIIAAESIDDLFTRLEAVGALHRLDAAVRPTTYRCAVVSKGELAQLQRIKDVHRMGHVRAIEPRRLTLDGGELAADADTLYVDCSASAIQPPPNAPIFEGEVIHLQMVRTCQPLFSAALVAWLEAHVEGNAARNAMARPIAGPERPVDWLRMWGVTLANTGAWRANPALMAWLAQCRLNGQAVMMRGMQPGDERRMGLLREVGQRSPAAAARIPALLAMAP